MKLTGPQQVTIGDADQNGLIFRGKHNEICHELRKLGLVKFEPQEPPFPGHPHQVPAWRLTESGIAARQAYTERGNET